MTLRSKCCCWVGISWVFLLLLLVGGLLAGAGNAIGWAYAPLSMVFVVVVAFSSTCDSCMPMAKKQSKDKAVTDLGDVEVEEQKTAKSAEQSGAAPLAAKKKPPRKYWLDNAKTTLTCMVVMGHSGMAFAGQAVTIGFAARDGVPSWFWPATCTGLAVLKPLVVPLFFLISGYFTPSSFDRKGPKKFLKVSVQRLGVVWFIFWVLLNPCMRIMANEMVQPTNAPWGYGPGDIGSPHTWFLSWLLVFQTLYAMTEDGKCFIGVQPTFSTLMKWSLGLAVLQLLASLVCALTGATLGFGEMPMMGPGGDGYFNVLGFVAGVAARRNGWLEEPISNALVKPARIYVALFAIIVPLMFFQLPPGHLDVDANTFALLFFGLQIPSGPFCVCLLIVVLDYFMRNCNTQTSTSKTMAKGAFFVYLFHYYIVTFATYIFVLILNGAHDGGDLVFENSTMTGGFYDDPTCVPFHSWVVDNVTVNSTWRNTTGECLVPVSDSALYAGFFFVSGTSVVTAFGLAAAIKKTPLGSLC